MTDFLVEENLGYCQTPGCKGIGQVVNDMCQECRLGFNKSLGQFFRLGKSGVEDAGKALAGVRGTLKHFMSDQVVGVIASNLGNFKDTGGFKAWLRSGCIAGITAENWEQHYKVAKGRWVAKSKMFSNPTHFKFLGLTRKVGEITSVPDAPPTEKERKALQARSKHDAEREAQTEEGKKMAEAEDIIFEDDKPEQKIPPPPKSESGGVEIVDADAPIAQGTALPIPPKVLGGGAEIKEKAPAKKCVSGTKVSRTKVSRTKV